MLTRAEDTDDGGESLLPNGGGIDLGADGSMGLGADDVGSVDGWAVVSVEDRSILEGDDDDDDDRRNNTTPTGFDLDPEVRVREEVGMVSSLSAADEGTANGCDSTIDGASFYEGYLGDHPDEESSDGDDEDDLLSIPDTVPSNVRSIRLERGANATQRFAAIRRRWYDQPALVLLLAASIILGSACTAYLAWDRSTWRQSALRLEAELQALREEEDARKKASSYRKSRHEEANVPPLFGEEEGPEPSILLADNCWVKATAIVSLGTCAAEVKDNVHRASETAYDNVVNAFRKTWSTARNATAGTAAAAASGTTKTRRAMKSSAAAAAARDAREFAKRCRRSASDSVAKSAGRVAGGLSAVASGLLSTETVTAVSETLMETNEMVEETLYYLLGSAKDAIEDSSTVFLKNSGIGRGSFEESVTKQQQQQQWDYGFLSHLLSGLFVNTTSKAGGSAADKNSMWKYESSYVKRFSDAMTRAIQVDAADVDEKERWL